MRSVSPGLAWPYILYARVCAYLLIRAGSVAEWVWLAPPNAVAARTFPLTRQHGMIRGSHLPDTLVAGKRYTPYMDCGFNLAVSYRTN